MNCALIATHLCRNLQLDNNSLLEYLRVGVCIFKQYNVRSLAKIIHLVEILYASLRG